MMKNSFTDVFNIGELKKSIESAITEMVASGELYQIRVSTLVSGASGKYLPHEVAKLFAEDVLCSDTEEEWYYNEWDELQSKINELLDSAVIDFKLLGENPFGQGFLRFYTDETDGDFILGLEVPLGTWDRFYTCKECGNLHDSHTSPRYNYYGKSLDKDCYMGVCESHYAFKSRSGGGVMQAICLAIREADTENTAKLYKGYPELVDGYNVFKEHKVYKEQ